MSGYHPDWLGAVTAGIAIGLSILVGAIIWPQKDSRKRVISVGVVVGVVLAVVVRTLMRHFGN